MFLTLALKSLLHRKFSVLLTIFSITLSIFVMLGVDHIKVQAKKSFNHTISDVDLIVGSRTSSMNLLLYTVFRIGSPTNNISWASFERIKANDKVKWAIPLSLGDSHKGYRVIGTNNDYFEHYKYGNKHALTFSNGRNLHKVFDVVIGFDVARTLGYQLDDKLTLAHGVVSTHFTQHSNKPFKVVGILKQTGTPVDQALQVSLEGLDTLHISSVTAGAAHVHEHEHDKANIKNASINKLYTPKNITAFMAGLKSKMSIFTMQRTINNDSSEPLLAILPGVALSELWQTLSILEGTLSLIALLVFISAILGLSAVLISAIKARNQEIHLLRTIGATPFFLYGFITLEAILITLLSKVLAISLLYLALLSTKDYLLSHYDLFINTNLFSLINMQWLALIFLCTLVAAIPSSIIAFRSCQR
jgi:putative ABC transport system permease protein